jgi:hypothetical protein
MTTTVATVIPCDRHRAHPAHEYVATATSPVILECPGVMPRRSVSQLLAERPELRDLPAPGVARHTLGVAAA